MLGSVRAQIHIGHATVVSGLLVAGLAFSYLVVHEDADLWSAFMKAAAADVATMVVLGVAERFWKNKKVGSAGVDASGSANVKFADEISTAVAEVNDAVSKHVETINKRLYDLEKAVFKDGDDVPRT